MRRRAGGGARGTPAGMSGAVERGRAAAVLLLPMGGRQASRQQRCAVPCPAPAEQSMPATPTACPPGPRPARCATCWPRTPPRAWSCASAPSAACTCAACASLSCAPPRRWPACSRWVRPGAAAGGAAGGAAGTAAGGAALAGMQQAGRGRCGSRRLRPRAAAMRSPVLPVVDASPAAAVTAPLHCRWARRTGPRAPR